MDNGGYLNGGGDDCSGDSLGLAQGPSAAPHVNYFGFGLMTKCGRN